MTTLAVNRSIQSQATLPSIDEEGPITRLPDELVEKSILFRTSLQDKNNTRLVSQSWNAMTLNATKFPELTDLHRFIRVLIQNLLKRHPHKSGKFSVIEDMLRIRTNFLVTPAQAQRLFLITKGCILGVLKKLSSTRIDQLQTAIGPQIPPSLNSLFDLAEMSLDEAIQTKNFDMFYLVLIHHPAIDESYLGSLVIDAAKAGQFRMLKVLLDIEKTSSAARELALGYVVEDNNKECAQLLLDYGPISVKGRGTLLDIATSLDHPAMARLLLAHGTITAEAQDWAIENAMDRGNIELAEFIRSSAQITS